MSRQYRAKSVLVLRNFNIAWEDGYQNHGQVQGTT